MSIESVNSFCSGFAKLSELVSSGKKDTDEAFNVIREMRKHWDAMTGKEAHYIERFTVKLADLGYYRELPSPPKVDISDLEFDDNYDVKDEFKYAKKILRPGRNYATYNYNEHSVPINQLPEADRKRIYEKSVKNAISTENGIQNPESARYNEKRNHNGVKLLDSERDW